MKVNEIKTLILKQKKYFITQKAKDVKFRIDNLKKLKKIILLNEDKILDALNKDLKKSKFEGFATEIGIIYDEINFHIKNLKKWIKPKTVKTPFIYFPAKSFIYPEPYGVVLIISPWNYPFQLMFAPLIGAISSGNCSVLKPSEYSTATAKVIEQIINKNFNNDYIMVINGDSKITSALLNEKFDYIFFTGSTGVGKIVMEAAGKNLTPITLELGGKSPCIIDYDANLEIAAKRITWGKFLNAGQTCVAPDYLYVHKSIKKQFLELLIKNIKEFYTDDPLSCDDYCKIINEKHFTRLMNLIKKAKIIYGGDNDKKQLYISPTILDNVKKTDPVMSEEIFGPILPIMEFSKLEETIDYINNKPKPLAFYYFGNDKNNQNKILQSISAGGGCINDTVTHVANIYLPFGGVGSSGIGSYHGKNSFDTFTHFKSVLKNSNKIDMKIKYPPYKNKIKMLKMIFK